MRYLLPLILKVFYSQFLKIPENYNHRSNWQGDHKTPKEVCQHLQQ